MRLIVFVAALFLAVPAAAADWKEYEFPDYSFAVHFPADPTIESTTYRAPDGRSLEAHVYSASHDGGTFKLTVVELPNSGTEENALVDHAVDALRQTGMVKFDIPHRIRSVYGRQLGVAGPDGSYSYTAVFYNNKRLYQIEGKALVAGGQAEADAMRFQQSLDLT
jgi:hypothetical protein